jgi:hypothetical protein
MLYSNSRTIVSNSVMNILLNFWGVMESVTLWMAGDMHLVVPW